MNKRSGKSGNFSIGQEKWVGIRKFESTELKTIRRERLSKEMKKNLSCR